MNFEKQEELSKYAGAMKRINFFFDLRSPLHHLISYCP